MASQRLPNYLRTFRKRSTLSQDDVAYLLGTDDGAKVCRYERFVQEPRLRTALACEIIFQKPISELFPGVFAEIEKQVKARAKKLVTKLCPQAPDSSQSRRRQALTIIASGNPSEKSK